MTLIQGILLIPMVVVFVAVAVCVGGAIGHFVANPFFDWLDKRFPR